MLCTCSRQADTHLHGSLIVETQLSSSSVFIKNLLVPVMKSSTFWIAFYFHQYFTQPFGAIPPKKIPAILFSGYAGVTSEEKCYLVASQSV